MSEQARESKTTKIPQAGGPWESIGGATFDKEREKIDWKWRGDETLVLTPGSSINFWRNDEAYEGQPDFGASCKISSGEGSSGRFRADHPSPGKWGRVGGGFLKIKGDRLMIAWSWTGERNLEVPPGSRFSIWKSKKPGAPEFQVNCLLAGGSEGGPPRTAARDSAVDDWMRSGAAANAGEAAGEPYRAPGAGEAPSAEHESAPPAGEGEGEGAGQGNGEAPGNVDPKTLAGNPAQDPAGAESAATEQSAPPKTQTYDDFDDDIPF